MTKGHVTALVISPEVIGWTTLRAGKNRHGAAADSGRAEPGLPRAIEDPDVLAESVARLKNGFGGPRGAVTVGLPSADLLLRVLELPAVEPEELQGIVELQADKFSPFPIENMIVSHEVLRRTEQTCIVLVVAIQARQVETLGRLLHGAGLSASRVDAEVLGWWRLLKDAGLVGEEGRHILVLLTDRTPELLVVQDGMPMVFRSMAQTEGLSQEELASEIAGEIAHTLMTLEIERGQTGTDSIAVCSPDGLAPAGLIEKLREECACDVSLKSLRSLPPLSEGIARRTADGGSLLDLTPAAWRESGKSKAFRKRMILTACTVFGLWMLTVVGLIGALYFQKSRLAGMKEKMTALEGPAMAVRETRDRVRVIRRYMDRSHSSLECLREISVAQPQGVELTSFTYLKGEQVKIVGEAPDVNQVYDFKNKLDACGLFTRTGLQGPRFDNRKRKQVFDIEMDLPGNKEP